MTGQHPSVISPFITLGVSTSNFETRISNGRASRGEIMNGIDAYRQTAIGTQSKGRLIVMLYDGAIKFMKLAIAELEAGELAAKGQYINRAQDILRELNIVLDMEAGGEIAGNLRRLYAFMIRRLSEANAERDPQMIREVIGLMEELNQSWKAITG
jgi:flagellar protein FliS